MGKLGQKIVAGTLWVAVDRVGSVLLQFVTNLVLARLLMPEDFGCIGMLAIFIAVSQVFIDAGFGSALIQDQNVTQEDYSTIFYWNLLFSFFLYVMLFCAAPLIAIYFNYPILCKVLRVFGLTLIINALTIVQNNRLRKELAFRPLAFINLSSYFIAAIIAVLLAYKGFGVWALVSLSLLCGIIQNILLWSIVRWRPAYVFSMASFRRLFNYGGYLFAASILRAICKNLQSLIIGRKFSATQVGLYAQADKMSEVPVNTISGIIVQSLFPVFSKIQDNKQIFHDLLGRSIRLISYCAYFILFLMILIARPLIVFLYGDKWIDSIPYFQILCVGGFFMCLQYVNYYAIAAIGRSRILFRWGIFKWGMLLLLLLVGSHWGMYGILWGMVISNFNFFIVNVFLTAKYVGYSMVNQLRDILPVLGIGCISFGATWRITQIMENSYLIFNFLTYTCAYFLVTFIFKSRVTQDIRKIKHIIFKKLHL